MPRISRRGRVGRGPRGGPPLKLEEDYARAVLSAIRPLEGITRDLITPYLKAQFPDESRKDASILRYDVEFSLPQLIARGRREAAAAIPYEDVASEAGELVYFETREDWQRAVKDVLGVDVLDSSAIRGQLQSFTRDNVSLIKTIDESYFTEIDSLIRGEFGSGSTWQAVQAKIDQRYDVGRWNAERLARDQVGKLNANLTQARHRSIGLTRYYWRGVDDMRQSEEHKILADQSNAGILFSYDNPPPAGRQGEAANPGEPILCRCWGEPEWADASV